MIPGIINAYLVRRLVVASLLVTLVFSGPVILVSLSAQLPNEAVFSKLAWPALASITSNILYHSIPAFVAATIVWCYADYSSDNTLVSLHMAGLSVRSVRAPALAVAVGGMVIAYALSCFAFPYTAGYMHDVVHSLHHDMNPSLLRAGRLNEVDGGRQAIYFRNWVDQDEIADVFIRETATAGEEKVYLARQAVFLRGSQKTGLVLLDGSMQIFSSETSGLRSASFDKLVLPMTEFGEAGTKRRWTGFQEYFPLAFLAARESAFKHPLEQRNWVREAVKRFGLPALALVHALLGLELLTGWGTVTGRLRQPVISICGIILAVHFGVVLMAEQISAWVHFAWVAVGMIVAELGVAIALMTTRWKASRDVPMMMRLAPSDVQNPLLSALPVVPPFSQPAEAAAEVMDDVSGRAGAGRWSRGRAPASFTG